MRKKRAFSLIEVIVSMGLLSMLLGSLFYWYSTLSRQKEQLNRAQLPLMEERYAHQRLHAILPKVDLPFVSTEDGMVFIFDNGLCEVPELSAKVLARLYHDTKLNALCLGIWPKPEGKQERVELPCKTTILLDGVEQCSFSFYFPPDPLKKPVAPKEIGKPRPQTGWQESWSGELRTLPALIKISIKRESCKGIEGHALDYVFDLPFVPIFPKELAS